MSYEHGTTHYNLPQTEAGDTRDWFDTNEAFRQIDEAIYSANQTAGQATADIVTVKEDISDLKDADTTMTGRVDGVESRVTATETRINRLETEVTDGVQDLKDSICSIEEASATAAYKHDTGDFFWYNDTLYKATANIAIGQQIVPDTNCKTTNITTELLAGGQGGVEIDDSVVSATKVWSSYKVNEEIKPKAGDTRYYSGKIQYYDGSAWQDAQIGGGDMPTLDYSNPLHTFGSGSHTFTATKDCYLLGSIRCGMTGNTAVTINGLTIANCDVTGSNAGSAQANLVIPCIKLSSGDVVTVSADSANLHVYEEK